MVKPLTDFVVTQKYGLINRSYSKGYHTGIDYAARGADKTVYVVKTGEVVQARFATGNKGADPKGWGNYVIIRCDAYDVIYAHLAQVSVVKGMKVKAGERVGIQGSTGNSTGPHLHLEVRKVPWTDHNDINPTAYLQEDPAIKIIGQNGYEAKGILVDGSIYGPVRSLLENHGHKVLWDGSTVRIIK